VTDVLGAASRITGSATRLCAASSHMAADQLDARDLLLRDDSGRQAFVVPVFRHVVLVVCIGAQEHLPPSNVGVTA